MDVRTSPPCPRCGGKLEFRHLWLNTEHRPLKRQQSASGLKCAAADNPAFRTPCGKCRTYLLF